MLPIPSSKYIPQLYNQYANTDRDSFTAKIDELLNDILTDVINLRYLFEPDRCPSSALTFLGDFVKADLKQTDSDQTKRIKIYYAILGHKNAGLWNDNVKNQVDAITGYDARIYRGYDLPNWIFIGDGVVGAGKHYAYLGGDGLTTYALPLIGQGNEIQIKGNIYVNCHYGVYTAVLTSDQLLQIIDLYNEYLPAYMEMWFGYINVAGQFTYYFVYP
jgi:hypothetical protein